MPSWVNASRAWKYPQKPEGIHSPGTVVMGSHGLPVVNAGNWTRGPWKSSKHSAKRSVSFLQPLSLSLSVNIHHTSVRNIYFSSQLSLHLYRSQLAHQFPLQTPFHRRAFSWCSWELPFHATTHFWHVFSYMVTASLSSSLSSLETPNNKDQFYPQHQVWCLRTVRTQYMQSVELN